MTGELSISILGFTAVLMCRDGCKSLLEGGSVRLIIDVFRTSSNGLINHGLAGIFWIYVVSVPGIGTALLSMVERSSM